ncbi:MAG: hypothetical protein U5R31_14665 [Acidimicrobiia bacterium]|nr:hypothetical protein [Acidimicrobiia bacterium]
MQTAAAVLADERLQRRGGVHVGDGHDLSNVRMTCSRASQASSTSVEVGHVGHRAAGVEVGQDHLLVVACEEVGRLGHEVDAAEDDVVGLGVFLGLYRQPERVAPGVAPLHDVVALVVVTQQEHPVPESALGLADPVVELFGDASAYRSGSGRWIRNMGCLRGV